MKPSDTNKGNKQTMQDMQDMQNRQDMQQGGMGRGNQQSGQTDLNRQGGMDMDEQMERQGGMADKNLPRRGETLNQQSAGTDKSRDAGQGGKDREINKPGNQNQRDAGNNQSVKPRQDTRPDGDKRVDPANPARQGNQGSDQQRYGNAQNTDRDDDIGN